MSKEVEALERIETTFSLNKQGKESAYRGYTNSVYPYYEDFDLVLNALKRLEAIDNANPSEAFNYLDIFINEMTYCLEHPKEYAKGYNKEIFYKYKYTFETTVKQALIKAQEQEKILNIIKEKRVNVNQLLLCWKVEMYNSRCRKGYELSKEEFELLKRWLKDE